MTAPYYAEAFSPLPGRCFRLVARDGEGGPVHCLEPPTWRGTFRAPNGRRYRVEACAGHRPPAPAAPDRAIRYRRSDVEPWLEQQAKDQE